MYWATGRLEKIYYSQSTPTKIREYFFKDDKYGRPLCNIYLYKTKYCIFKYIDTYSINDIMIDNGFGYKYNGGKKKNFKDLQVEV